MLPQTAREQCFQRKDSRKRVKFYRVIEESHPLGLTISLPCTLSEMGELEKQTFGREARGLWAVATMWGSTTHSEGCPIREGT